MARDGNGPRIVVAGGGYAGVVAALRLSGRTRHTGARVALVNDSDWFVERVRLHQLASGQRLVERSLPAMLAGRGIEFVQARVARIDLDRNALALSTGADEARLSYDMLVYALGSTAAIDGPPGARAHTLRVPAGPDARRVAAMLPELAARRGRLVVCGGGLQGIETATEIAEAHPGLRVALVTDGVLGPGLSQKGRAHIRRAFERLGIEPMEQHRVTAVHAGGLECHGQSAMTFDLCIWAAGLSVPSLAREAGLPVNDLGQLVLDHYMRAASATRVYGAGDAATTLRQTGEPLRMACATATPMAAHAADCIAAEIAGREPRPFRFRYAGQCISLGRRDAVVQLVRANDAPKERVITGRPAAWIKERISRYAFNAHRFERVRAGSLWWPRGEPYPAAVEQRAGA